jgi:hypothetical protein
VTAAGSVPGSSRTASSTAVQDVRPDSSATTNEYGQPGIIWCLASPRPKVWQNDRSGQVFASGRSHGKTSTASSRRPSAARGSGRPASSVRSRSTSSRPRFSAPYRAPCPRVLGRRRQVHQGPHRPVAAQHRVGELEQRVAPPGQAVVEDPSEAGQFRRRLALHTLFHHTHHGGLHIKSCSSWSSSGSREGRTRARRHPNE